MRAYLTIVAVLFAILLAGASKPKAEPPVPVDVQHKIAAVFGPDAYVPSWIPRGFMFIKWEPGAPDQQGVSNGSTVYDKFTITFAHRGEILLWRLDPPYDAWDCQNNYSDAKAVIHGRHVAYSNGNHGQSGYWCFGKKGQQGEISTWDDHLFSSAVEMKIVASASLAR